MLIWLDSVEHKHSHFVPCTRVWKKDSWVIFLILVQNWYKLTNPVWMIRRLNLLYSQYIQKIKALARFLWNLNSAYCVEGLYLFLKIFESSPFQWHSLLLGKITKAPVMHLMKYFYSAHILLIYLIGASEVFKNYFTHCWRIPGRARWKCTALIDINFAPTHGFVEQNRILLFVLKPKFYPVEYHPGVKSNSMINSKGDSTKPFLTLVKILKHDLKAFLFFGNRNPNFVNIISSILRKNSENFYFQY